MTEPPSQGTNPPSSDTEEALEQFQALRSRRSQASKPRTPGIALSPIPNPTRTIPSLSTGIHGSSSNGGAIQGLSTYPTYNVASTIDPLGLQLESTPSVEVSDRHLHALTSAPNSTGQANPNYASSAPVGQDGLGFVNTFAGQDDIMDLTSFGTLQGTGQLSSLDFVMSALPEQTPAAYFQGSRHPIQSDRQIPWYNGTGAGSCLHDAYSMVGSASSNGQSLHQADGASLITIPSSAMYQQVFGANFQAPPPFLHPNMSDTRPNLPYLPAQREPERDAELRASLIKKIGFAAVEAASFKGHEDLFNYLVRYTNLDIVFCELGVTVLTEVSTLKTSWEREEANVMGRTFTALDVASALGWQSSTLNNIRSPFNRGSFISTSEWPANLHVVNNRELFKAFEIIEFLFRAVRMRLPPRKPEHSMQRRSTGPPLNFPEREAGGLTLESLRKYIRDLWPRFQGK